jgi:molybdate transport system substrate-binding protein
MQRLAVIGVVAALGACSTQPAPRKLRIAAASDLAHAFAELATQFQARTGIAVEVEYGSSGLLAKQIEQGAPFALYAAANRGYVDQVIRAGKCDAATAQSYALGRLVVWTRAGTAPPATLAELANPRFRKIAIANPAHAPYGKAARQALEAAGVWPRIQDRIVLGENVQATMLYARDGNADVALIAHALAAMTPGGSALPVDPALHAPLDQAMVVCGTGATTEAAKQLEGFIASPEGRAVLTRHGFAPPHAPTPATP